MKVRKSKFYYLKRVLREVLSFICKCTSNHLLLEMEIRASSWTVDRYTALLLALSLLTLSYIHFANTKYCICSALLCWIGKMYRRGLDGRSGNSSFSLPNFKNTSMLVYTTLQHGSNIRTNMFIWETLLALHF